MSDIIIQKKRGRKPKNKNEDLVAEEDKIKKKRGRKPTGKIYEINKTLITNMSSNISNCIIAHLPLTDKDISKIINKSNDDDIFSETDLITNDIETLNIAQLSINAKSNPSTFIIEVDDNLKYKYEDKCLELENIKKKYEEILDKFKKYSYLEDKITDNGMIDKKYYIANSELYDISGNGWKESTKSHCWWCSHSFETVPVGLPNKYCLKEKKFFLYGCFCSFNCAHAYNLELKDYKIWERYSLLNYMKKIIFKDDNVKIITSAPPKEILELYGGTFTIEAYRNTSISIPKEYFHLLPPMIPMFSVIEEIPKFFYQDKKKKNDFGDLKLKRSKPIANVNNNLLNLFK